MMIVVLCGRSKDYDLPLVEQVGQMLLKAGYDELWLADPTKPSGGCNPPQ